MVSVNFQGLQRFPMGFKRSSRGIKKVPEFRNVDRGLKTFCEFRDLREFQGASEKIIWILVGFYDLRKVSKHCRGLKNA